MTHFGEAEIPPPVKKPKLTTTGVIQSQQNTKKDSAQMDTSSNARNGTNTKSLNELTMTMPGEINHDNLYSRQIYAIGHSAMQYLRDAKVLISGMGSVGVELAKNLILTGVRHVSIHDTKTTRWHDLSAQFYLSESDLGKNRAEACFDRLEELNGTVKCSLSTVPLTEDFIKEFDLVIITDAPFSEQLAINNFTRAHGKRFISCDARGLFSYIFVDLGSDFIVEDLDGEQPKDVLIESMDLETGGVFTVEEVSHGFEDGDFIEFEEVKGFPMDLPPFKVTVTSRSIFNIGDKLKQMATGPISGGRARQVKMPKNFTFKSLAEALEAPDFFIWDFAKFDQPAQLHILWQALYKFEEKYGRSPESRSQEDAQLLAAELPSDMTTDKIPPKLLSNFSFQARGNLQPVASFTGGIAAQEAMKAVTHHTTPIVQFLYTESFEALPGSYSIFDYDKLAPEDCAPRHSRYDGQAAIFGWSYQEALLAQSWFVVGAGAIGCELLKNMAMMGVGCGPRGEIRITDMDQIELSNLNRQFLFRQKDIGSRKSEVAGRAAKQFNSLLNIRPYTERVADDTEHIFDDEFFKGLTGVANALDNVDARRYMDRRCVFYQLPLLESGTMGTKGNTQVVYPKITESYGSSSDPPEKETPSCTLRNFPYMITHTIQWSREKFGECFTTTSEITNDYLDDTKQFLSRLKSMNISQRIDLLRTLNRMLIDEKPKSFEDCVKWSRELFDQWFRNEIAQLLHNFPPDQLTSSGLRFWSGTKRCPHPLEFNTDDQNHMDFVFAGTLLRAQQYKIPLPFDEFSPNLQQHIAQLAVGFQSKPFVPRSGIRIAVTDAEAAENAQQTDTAFTDPDETERILDELNLRLAKLGINELKQLTQIDFEKDDDTNHHVEFVAAASNLRAANYNIESADRMKTKQIAGKIIPALATTTAVVAGLVCIELYKTVGPNGAYAQPVPMDRFKNSFINLALPFIGFSEPIGAPVKKYGDKEFTLWDCLEVQGPKLFGELIDWIENSTGTTVSMLSSGNSLLYAFFQPQKRSEREKMQVEDVVELVSRSSIPAHRRSLIFEVMCTGTDDDEDVEIPYIKYIMASRSAPAQ